MIKDWKQYKDLEYYPDRFCACGCGGRIKVRSYHSWYGIPKYIPNGHAMRGKKHTKETKRKQSLSKLGDRNPTKRLEVRKKMSISNSKPKPKVSKSLKKLWQDIEYQEKQRKAHEGHIPSEETRRKMSKSHTGKRRSKEQIENYKRAAKKRCRNPEYIRNFIAARDLRPNKPEKLLNKLLQELFLNEWKYVGDGSFIVGYKNPDFININGQKKIIELFGDYWHSRKVTGRTKIEEEKQRINHFARYGFQTLVIWEHELENISNIVDRIKEFNNE